MLHVHNHKQVQSRSSSWSRRNRGAAAEVDAFGEQQLAYTHKQ